MVYIPKTDEHFEASLAVIPLQLMGYYVSVAKGLDVDKPRNLAKSVSFEAAGYRLKQLGYIPQEAHLSTDILNMISCDLACN